MAFINDEAYKQAAVDLEKLFFTTLEKGDPKNVVGKIAAETTIGAATLVMPFTDLLGGMREWVGDRVIQDLVGQVVTVTPRHWEKTIGINKDWLADDMIGLAGERIQGLAGVLVRDYRKKVVQMLHAGWTEIGYDKKAIFATDHPKKNGTINNTSSEKLDATGIAAALEHFDTLVSFEGEPLDITPNLLVCGPANRAAAEAVLQQRTLANGGDNINYGRFELLVDSRIPNDYWYVLATNEVEKPIRLVKRTTGELRFDEPFLRNEYMAGVDARHDCIFTAWQLCWGSDG